MNERIRAREVRLIDENGVQMGVMPTREALRVARERDLDLIEVAPNAEPPVCRIMDYGKHKYLQAKRERGAHRHSKATEVRLLRLKPQISDHDLEIKLRKLRELIGEEGSKVRVNLRFRGREMTHPELGTRLLERIAEELASIASVEMAPRMEGRMMNMMLVPRPSVRPAAKAKPAAPPPEKAKEKPAEPVAPAPAPTPQKAVAHAQEPVQQVRVEPRPQTEDTEDSGEAG